MAGLRIGWLATHDRELLARLAAFKDYTTICSSGPSEILAIIALRARDQVLAAVARDHRREPRAGRRVLRGLGRPVQLGPPAGRLDRLPAADRARASGSTTGRPGWSRRPASCCCPARSSSSRATTSGSASAGPTCPRRSTVSRRTRRRRSADRQASPADGDVDGAARERRQATERVAVQVDQVPVAAGAPVDELDRDARPATADADRAGRATSRPAAPVRPRHTCRPGSPRRRRCVPVLQYQVAGPERLWPVDVGRTVGGRGTRVARCWTLASTRALARSRAGRAGRPRRAWRG